MWPGSCIRPGTNARLQWRPSPGRRTLARLPSREASTPILLACGRSGSRSIGRRSSPKTARSRSASVALASAPRHLAQDTHSPSPARAPDLDHCRQGRQACQVRCISAGIAP